ncbi:MAG TPA: DUF2599 domain-containing protein, partial [Candidatus Nanopelagicales bacterium]|nr:DUF2599 domain-containing protein [Candidatus Nanopelagicales bacterium]
GERTMKQRRYSALAVAVIGLLAISPAAAVHADNTETLDVLLVRVAPEVRENLYEDASASRGPNAEAVTPATVPLTADQPITTHGEATDVSIWLPGSAAASEGTVAGESVRVFDHRNGASSVPLVKDDGSVQILTIIAEAGAPEEYSYALGVPDGASLAVAKDGAVRITGADDEFIGGVAPAWAVDAKGAAVPTRYEVAGTTLTQVIDHDGGEFSYPIVADPWLGQDLYYTPWVSFVLEGYKVNVTPTAWGVQMSAVLLLWAHRDEVVSKLGLNAWRWTNTIQEQFYCHVAGVPFSLWEYNMESWRPVVPWPVSLPLYQCNP